MATTAPPLNPRQTGGSTGKGSKRVFRSISRFLSRGGEKQRPKLPHQSNSDPVPTVANTTAGGQEEHGEGVRTPSRSRSRSRSGSRSGSRSRSPFPHHLPNGDDHDGGFSPEEGVPHLGPSLSHRRRSGSLSNLSALSGADTDASIYPISPSTRSRPASSIISKRTAGTLDSASVASFAPTQGGSTYAKSYASTKPTTLLSVDSGGGANRIAVVPGTGSHFTQQSYGQVLSTNVGTGSSSIAAGSPISANGPGITFSSLPSGSPSSATSPYSQHLPHTSTSSSSPHRPTYSHLHRPSTSSSNSSLSHHDDDNLATPGVSPSLLPSPAAPDSPSSFSRPLAGSGGDDHSSLIGAHAPPYTNAHPRNNPHPAQPPPDNASVLTLASSSFAPSFIGSTTGGGGGGGARSSWTSAAASPALALGGLKAWSTKQARSLGGAKGRDSLSIVGGADEDASVRALAGSRRPSEESLGGRSTWSAVVLNNTAEGRGKERQMSVLSKEVGEGDGVGVDGVQASGEGGEREEGEKAEGFEEDKKATRRRASSYGGSSLRHEVDAAPTSPKEDEGEKLKESKGKGVADEEHVGVVNASSAPAAASLEPTLAPFVPPAPESDTLTSVAVAGTDDETAAEGKQGVEEKEKKLE